MKYLFILFVAFTLASCCGPASQTDDTTTVPQNETKVADVPGFTAPGNWKTIDTLDFIIRYPAAWKLDKYGTNGALFALTYAIQQTPDEITWANMTLMSEDISANPMDLDTYSKVSEGHIKEAFPDFCAKEDTNIKVGSITYHKLLYTASQPGGLHSELEQWFRVTDSKAYVLTFTTDIPGYMKYKEQGEYIMSTFVLKN